MKTVSISSLLSDCQFFWEKYSQTGEQYYYTQYIKSLNKYHVLQTIKKRFM